MYNIFHTIKDICNGQLKFTSKQIAKDRYNTCLSCEIRNSKLNICTACGCYLPWKTKLKDAKCPIEAWK